jgi:hypothetical protein
MRTNSLINEILIAYSPYWYWNLSNSEIDLDVVCYVDLINAKNDL